MAHLVCRLGGLQLVLQAAIGDGHTFDAETRLGGHANTVTIDYGGAAIAVDTGFIVFNNASYPNLVAMLDHLDVGNL